MGHQSAGYRKLCGEYSARKLNTIGKEEMEIIYYIELIVEEAFVIEVLLKSGQSLCHPQHVNSRGLVGFRDSISDIEHRFGFGLFNRGCVSLGEECRLYVSENRLLRRMSEHSLKEIRGSGENCMVRTRIIYIFG